MKQEQLFVLLIIVLYVLWIAAGMPVPFVEGGESLWIQKASGQCPPCFGPEVCLMIESIGVDPNSLDCPEPPPVVIQPTLTALQQNRLNHLVKYWMQDYIDSRTEFEGGIVITTRYYFPVTTYIQTRYPNEKKPVHSWQSGKINLNAFVRVAGKR